MIARPTPLQWPESFARTKPSYRSGGRFKMSFPAALKSLHDAMKRRGLSRYEYVISSNLPLKGNGDPTPVGAHIQDSGIAVYWKEQNKPIRVVACDQFWSADQNIRALALTLEHLRDMERWGCTQLVEHIMDSGFALPGPGQTSTGSGNGASITDIEPDRSWCTVLGVDLDAITSSFGSQSRVIVESIYKAAAKKYHPDAGGSTQLMADLNRAWESAQAWFTWYTRHSN